MEPPSRCLAFELAPLHPRYKAMNGVHGQDSFSYAVTDCMGFGPSADISVTIPAPSAAFVALPFASYSAIATDESTSMDIDIDVPVESGTARCALHRPF